MSYASYTLVLRCHIRYQPESRCKHFYEVRLLGNDIEMIAPASLDDLRSQAAEVRICIPTNIEQTTSVRVGEKDNFASRS